MLSMTRTSLPLRSGFWLLAAALVLPATAGSIGAACCVMEAPCCPENSTLTGPTLSGPVPGCCERVLATDREAPADRRGMTATPHALAVLVRPDLPAPPTIVRTGLPSPPERCSDPPLSSRTGRSPPRSIV